MMFGRGQQPYRKRTRPACDKSKTKASRKKARDHAKQEKEVDELPKETDFDEDEDYDEDYVHAMEMIISTMLQEANTYSIVVKTRTITDLMDHIIAEGNRVYKGTKREDTWLIFHDHLKIWWEKESQEYLKSLPCPIEGSPSRTWWDRQIKICGDENNAKVSKRYRNCLPGDSPELMPLDCHLFADLKEGAGKNVALTFHINENDENAALKYSFATPKKVYSALQ
jgi:hypothetical protein